MGKNVHLSRDSHGVFMLLTLSPYIFQNKNAFYILLILSATMQCVSQKAQKNKHKTTDKNTGIFERNKMGKKYSTIKYYIHQFCRTILLLHLY